MCVTYKGQSEYIDVSWGEDIDYIKTVLSTILGIPPIQQTLMCNGEVLSDGKFPSCRAVFCLDLAFNTSLSSCFRHQLHD